MHGNSTLARLFALLASPPPLSTGYLALHLALISGYTVFLHAEVWLQARGYSAFVLACVLFMVLSAWRVMPVAVFSGPSPDSARRRGAIGVILTLVMATLFLAFNDPLLCQRAFSVAWAFQAIYLTYGALRSPEHLDRISWIGRTLREGRENAALWSAAGCAALLAINEYVIANWSLTDWILMRSFAPIMICSLVWWSILATHQSEAR